MYKDRKHMNRQEMKSFYGNNVENRTSLSYREPECLNTVV